MLLKAIRTIAVLFPVLLWGCSFGQTDTAKIRIQEAEIAILTAKKAKDSTSVDNSKIELAESYYDRAVEDYKKTSSSASMLFAAYEKGALNQSAIIYATLAKNAAKKAMDTNQGAVATAENSDEVADRQIAELKATIAQLEKNLADSSGRTSSADGAAIMTDEKSRQLLEEQARLETEIERLRATLQAMKEISDEPEMSKSVSQMQAMYKTAFRLFNSYQYAESLDAFERFFQVYPDTTLSDNARYWIGECRYAMKDYPQAIVEFESLMETFKDTNKADDTLLKLGLCHYRLDNVDFARQYWQATVDRYPKNRAASWARKFLQKIE